MTREFQPSEVPLNPSPAPVPQTYATATMMAAMGQAQMVRSAEEGWGRPYILSGPEPDMGQPDVAVVSHLAALARYYVKPYPGMVLKLESIAYSTAQPPWFVSFRDVDGKHVFHEASGGGYVCREMAGFLQILDQCRYKLQDRFGEEAA